MYTMILAAAVVAGDSKGWNDFDWGWSGYSGYYGCSGGWRGYGCSGYGYGCSGYGYGCWGYNRGGFGSGYGYGGYSGAYGSYGSMGCSGFSGSYGSYASYGNRYSGLGYGYGNGYGYGGYGYGGYPVPPPAPVPPYPPQAYPPPPGAPAPPPGYRPPAAPRGVTLYPMGGMGPQSTIIPPAPPIPVDAASITVYLPENARLFANNQFASDYGPRMRQFVTPSLRPGTEYFYVMRMEVAQPNGQVVTETRQVNVRAGQQLTISFLPPNAPRVAQGY